MMNISWKTAAVLITVLVAIVVVLLAGPSLMSAESYAAIIAGLGAAGAVALAVMRPLVQPFVDGARAYLRQDRDGDGIPDFVDDSVRPPPLPPRDGAS